MKRSVDCRDIIDRRAARRPGQLSVHSHGWELFSSDTSSCTRAHPIDFINPDCHLLRKKHWRNFTAIRRIFSEFGSGIRQILAEFHAITSKRIFKFDELAGTLTNFVRVTPDTRRPTPDGRRRKAGRPITAASYRTQLRAAVHADRFQ